MTKRLDIFDGLSRPVPAAPNDWKAHEGICDCDTYGETIERLVDDDSYQFAHDTLNSIHGFWEERGHLTDAQKSAIENIENRGR